MPRSSRRLALAAPWFPIALAAVIASPQSVHAAAQDLLNDNTNLFSGATLNLRPYVTIPGPDHNHDIISMTTRLGDTRLYVTTQEGPVYVVDQDGGGNTTPTLWFNAATAMTATGHALDQAGDNAHAGLQSVAFHPDFEKVGTPGYGKFYTTLLETKPASDAGHFFLGNTSRGGGINSDSVLVEWTFNHNTGTVDPSSYREVFRVKLPVFDHLIKQARFNLYAQPGDEDYGLLYLTHGDSSSQQSTEDRPKYLDNPLGKMTRINPLQSGIDRYTVPTTNPFYNYSGPTPAGHPTVLGEIYAYGMRNPHNFSFNRDDQGNIRIIDGDIGRNNIEEVNLITAGGFYGWTEREGTFVHLQGTDFTAPDANAGYIWGVGPLPANEDDFLDGYGNRNTYPVAQYDHNAPGVQLGYDYVSAAIASGFVIRNGSDPALQNQFIFTNFGGQLDGVGAPVFHTDFDEMLNAVTQLDPNDPARDQPSELTQAVKYRLNLALDSDNNPNTPPTTADDLNILLNGTINIRNEGRFGEGVFGEMYISSKTTGIVYLVTNSVPVPGDFNKDRVVDAADYTAWRDGLGRTGYHLAADGNGDGVVDDVDYGIWKDHFGQVWSASGSGTGGSMAVPEPTPYLLVFSAALALMTARVSRARGETYLKGWTRRDTM